MLRSISTALFAARAVPVLSAVACTGLANASTRASGVRLAAAKKRKADTDLSVKKVTATPLNDPDLMSDEEMARKLADTYRMQGVEDPVGAARRDVFGEVTDTKRGRNATASKPKREPREKPVSSAPALSGRGSKAAVDGVLTGGARRRKPKEEKEDDEDEENEIEDDEKPDADNLSGGRLTKEGFVITTVGGERRSEVKKSPARDRLEKQRLEIIARQKARRKAILANPGGSRDFFAPDSQEVKDEEIYVDDFVEMLRDEEGDMIDIKVLDVTKKTHEHGLMMFITTQSPQHLRSVAKGIYDVVKGRWFEDMYAGSEDLNDSEWAVIWAGNIMFHVMTKESKKHNKVEEYWRSEAMDHGVINDDLDFDLPDHIRKQFEEEDRLYDRRWSQSPTMQSKLVEIEVVSTPKRRVRWDEEKPDPATDDHEAAVVSKSFAGRGGGFSFVTRDLQSPAPRNALPGRHAVDREDNVDEVDDDDDEVDDDDDEVDLDEDDDRVDQKSIPPVTHGKGQARQRLAAAQERKERENGKADGQRPARERSPRSGGARRGADDKEDRPTMGGRRERGDKPPLWHRNIGKDVDEDFEGETEELRAPDALDSVLSERAERRALRRERGRRSKANVVEFEQTGGMGKRAKHRKAEWSRTIKEKEAARRRDK